MRIPQRHIMVDFQNRAGSDAIFAYLETDIRMAVTAGDLAQVRDLLDTVEDLNLYREVASFLAPMN